MEGEQVLRKKFSKNELKGRIESYLKSLAKTQKNFITIISKLEREDMNMNYKDMNKPLTTKDGILRSAGEIANKLGKNRLCKLRFDIPRGKVTMRQAVMPDKAKEEMPSTSDVANADDIELQEITENVARSMESLIEQLEIESSKDLPMRELLGLDTQLRSIRGLLKVEVAKKVQLEERIEKEKHKL